MNEAPKLTVKQEKFCNKYLECGNASEAYRFSHNAQKMKPETINRAAYDLLNNPKITARLEELRSALQQKDDISKERVLSEFAKIAFSSIASMHNTWIDKKEFEKLSENEKSCIKSIQTRIQRKVINEEIIEVEQIKIELYDKLKALENINKMLGYEAPVKTAQTDSKGNDLKRPLSPTRRAEILKETE